VTARRIARAFDTAVEHSIVLPVGVVIALAWANTAGNSYVSVAHALQFIVNDIGMAFFFALATKEVVEATAPGGALHPWRRAAYAARDPGLFVPAPAEARDPLSELEHRCKYPMQIVLLFFGLANAGVQAQQVGTGTWVVLSAILAGKPIGIVATVATAVAAGLHLPARVTWRDLIVLGFAAAIGFTVALFFAIVAFPAGPLLNQAKMGALLSISGAVAAMGAAALLRVGRFGRRAARP